MQNFCRIYPARNSKLYDKYFSGNKGLAKAVYKVLHSPEIVPYGATYLPTQSAQPIGNSSRAGVHGHTNSAGFSKSQVNSSHMVGVNKGPDNTPSHQSANPLSPGRGAPQTAHQKNSLEERKDLARRNSTDTRSGGNLENKGYSTMHDNSTMSNKRMLGSTTLVINNIT